MSQEIEKIKKKMFEINKLTTEKKEYSYLSDEMQFTSESEEKIEYIEDFAVDKQF